MPAMARAKSRASRKKRSRDAELVKMSELASLEKVGVLELRGGGDTAGYSGIDLKLLDILAEVRRLGLGDVFPVSIAEPYMVAVKKLVELEIDIFRHRALNAQLPSTLP